MIFSFFKKKNKSKQEDKLKKAEESRAGMEVTAVASGKNDDSIPEIKSDNPLYDNELKDLVFEYSFETSSLYMMYKEWFSKKANKENKDCLDIYSFINNFVEEVSHEPELMKSPNKLGIEYANDLVDFIDGVSVVSEELTDDIDFNDNDDFFYKKDELKDSQEHNTEEDETAETENKAEETVNKNSSIWLFVSEDKLRAYIVLLPKRKKGFTPTYDRVLEELETQGIKFGVDTKLIKKITDKKLYFQMFVVARGVDKVDGRDGEVIEHYPRKIKIVLKEDEFGNTDFKNLGNIKNITKGSIICDIVLPTSGNAGYNVYGDEIPCKDGEMPIIPMGENTNLTDDELHLVASCDGCVNYHDDMFYVRQLLYIRGNVDPHTGNIEFKGDIIIEGDVLEGYSVKADGNLRVQGTVENSSLTAGGGISITGGVKGNEKAVLNSGSEIKSLFLESCTVKAKNGIYSESIINSSIHTDDCVSVDRGKGIILGGTIIARNYVQAKIIGNQSGRTCTIKLGTNYNVAEEKASLSKELDDLEKELRNIKKDLLFFERGNNMSSDKKEKYSALKSKAGLYANQIRIKQKKLNEIVTNGFDISECFFRAKESFPPVNLTIGTHNTIIRMPYYNSKCYFSSKKDEFRIVNYDEGKGGAKGDKNKN